ncbi:16S rRNA (guanine(966)-N(2))-methyltransferase RsmD [Pseudolactococcus insecticola]|uniref:rRNA methyltransferase n=1 Tax=Pseudolactococcus insecticola TaxID=2709158 RepID=A0A6A0B6L8_9LACT|nr:16S rRNA (guanine(966)-N(2))-methyltransferase RsmD [Lactococcus insecticola]GFH40980.1 rRNA methyltransferase [Lactococcus insecticola]
MRVVAGIFGGRPLKTLDGKTTRPTSDKVKGAIFSMLGQFFEGGRVLDLYAGSGSLSIEAVSRGADAAVLVERDRKAQQIIIENIEMTKETERFSLMKMSSERALSLVDMAFDLVFLDPPYAEEQVVKDITFLEEKSLITSSATIVCETDKNVMLPETIGSFSCAKEKVYGISRITIYERNEVSR